MTGNNSTATAWLLEDGDPLLSHHPTPILGEFAGADSGELCCIDVDNFGQLVAEVFENVERVWTLARAREFLASRGIRTGWSVREQVLVIERHALLRLSPQLMVRLSMKKEIRTISIAMVATDGSTKLRGAPPVLTLLIATSKNVDPLIEGEIVRFATGMGIDLTSGVLAGKAGALTLKVLAVAAGSSIVIPLAGSLVVATAVGVLANHLADRFAAKRKLESLLREAIESADRNRAENEKELKRSRRRLQGALTDPHAAFQLIRALTGAGR